MSEFDLIRRYFTRPAPNSLLGVGDDAALVQTSPGNVLAVSSDMLVCGTHFLANTDAFSLGHKTLAVNLSDMAAMGATPRWATLAIALPEADEAWLAQFSAGFFALAERHGTELIGGDTTKGPLNLCVTIFGEVPAHLALRRSGAKMGDEIWVSGCLGDAALALAHLQGRIVLAEAALAATLPALHQPQPRVELGLALRGIASSAIDISDGLLGDLGHILEASNVAAQLDFAALPISVTLRGFLSNPSAARYILCGGDDYELCFTAPVAMHGQILSIAARLALPLTSIGKITAGSGCVVQDAFANPLTMESSGYDHFR